jgi:hypothetical protein
MTTRNQWLRALLLGGVAWCGCASSAAAQAEGQFVIRVQSDLVQIPTQVFAKVPRGRTDTFWQDSQGRSPISGLSAKDFHIFQDGVEQTIENFTVEPWPFRIVRDNVACHAEQFTTLGTRWTAGDYALGACPAFPRYTYYQVSFRPPATPAGSCHHVAVTVDLPDAVAETRGEYCNTPYSGFDELNGTPTGRWMESRLASETAGKFTLFVQAGWIYAEAPMARVHIALDLPYESMKTEQKNGRLWGTFRVLGMIYRKNGGLAKRFSDHQLWSMLMSRAAYGPSGARYLAYRYEKQFDLPPGEYDLRVVFSDGTTNFGRAETPLTVDGFDEKQLGISSVLLGVRYHEPSPLPQAERAGSFVPLLSDGIEVTPSGRTRFQRGEPLIAFFEVNEPPTADATEPKVQINLRIVGATGGAVPDMLQPFDAAAFRKASSPVIPITQKIPTKKLKKGSYRLEVQATDSVGRSTLWRSASFTIE